MKTNLKQVLTIAVFFCFFSGMMAQATYWERTTEDETTSETKVERNSSPKEFKLYKLDLHKFKEKLAEDPLRKQISGKSGFVMKFPMPSGKFQSFRITESPVMPAELGAKFPNIKTYSAVGIDDPTATMRFSITQYGLHAMSLSGKSGQNMIDPYTKDALTYIVYNTNTLSGGNYDFECSTNEGDPDRLARGYGDDYTEFSFDTDDAVLRTYRLALSCNSEYGNFFGTNPGTEKADIMAEMVIAINRVNEIYERELAITLEFVPNNDELIFYGDSANDPWADIGDFGMFTGEYNDRIQEVTDSIIGDSGYDIGHNFNLSGGGNAGCIGCVCVSGQKGSGYTGLPNPVGDAFYVDYVAHEMGHQFGGYHVMNTCSRSGSGVSEVEPASGSTIMGYAGICDANIQPHSDATFNYVSIKDIATNVQPGGNSTCGAQTNLTNQPPTADAGDDYTIPISTAYVLKGEGSDPDGKETLTYKWAQNDPEEAPADEAPHSDWTNVPLYRALLPSESPNRYMPELSEVVNGNLTPMWEVTPSVGRVLHFSFVVSDNGSGFAEAIGQSSSDLMKVTVDGNAGPFLITSQDSQGIEWGSGETQEVTWDVANTDSGNVNESEVDIILSIDGGENFDIIVAEGLPNNGSAQITVPSISSQQTDHARLMVRAHHNIFYALNQTEFSVTDEMSVDTPIEDSFTFYPNPNNGQFNVEFAPISSEPVSIKVYDLNGKVVFDQRYEALNDFNQRIVLNNVQSGLYFMRVENDSTRINKKLIVN